METIVSNEYVASQVEGGGGAGGGTRGRILVSVTIYTFTMILGQVWDL